MAGERSSDTTRRPLRHVVVALATMASMIFFSPAWAQENASDTPEEKPERARSPKVSRHRRAHLTPRIRGQSAGLLKASCPSWAYCWR